MDQLYDDPNAPADNRENKKNIELTPQAYNTVDPFFELEKLKKKHGESNLNKHLNEKYNDDFRRSIKLKNRLKEKLQKKKISSNNNNNESC
tara:strand:- start:1141 stop:1413 length:273 start_codon:yes stop_codon:yes gene_type:complete